MEVSPRLRQALSIDTSISYSLDMSRFPGLDDPRHQSQPVLLISESPGYCSVVQDKSEIIPSPTLDLPESTDDLLQDILSVIEKHDSDFVTGPTGSDNRHTPSVRNNHYLHSTDHRQVVQQNPNTGSQTHANPQVCSVSYHKDIPKSIPDDKSCMSKYAMDMIFHKLIYPDVSLGRSFNLDTLIQSAPKDTRRHQSLFRSTGDYVTRLNTITGSGNTTSTLKYGKRKRGSCEVQTDFDNSKRLRYEARISTTPVVWNGSLSNIGHPHGRLILS